MRVWLDPNKLYNYNLTTLDVVNAIQGQNVQVVAGQLGGPPVPPAQTFQFTVNALGRLEDVAQFENIIIKSARAESAQIVRIRDVARVELSQQSYSNFAGDERPPRRPNLTSSPCRAPMPWRLPTKCARPWRK